MFFQTGDGNERKLPFQGAFVSKYGVLPTSSACFGGDFGNPPRERGTGQDLLSLAYALTLRVTRTAVFGCRPDQGPCRNSANASIVSLRLHYQRRFYLRPKFRQLQRLLGPAYSKSATAELSYSIVIAQLTALLLHAY